MRVNQPMHSTVNAFSSPSYLGCVADAFYPGRSHEVRDCTVAGRTFRLLRVARSGWQPEAFVSAAPFMDFLEPIGGSLQPNRGSPAYLPNVSLARVSALEWNAMPEAAKARVQPAPLIDYTLF